MEEGGYVDKSTHLFMSDTTTTFTQYITAIAKAIALRFYNASGVKKL